MQIDLKEYPLEAHIHLYRQNGMNIAYDVNSGSLHVLDDGAYGYISEWLAYQKRFPQSLARPEEMLAATGKGLSPQERTGILGELARLQEEQLLFSRPVSHELLRETSAVPAVPVIKAICLHVAHDCNLRCGYCFADEGCFGGERGFMSFEVGKRALDFIVKASGNRAHCEVDFFGGEPLLNWPVVRDLVGYGRELEQRTGKKIKFTMTTNAVLFTDEVQDFVEKEQISVVLSLDGRPEVHDRMRPFADGSGSYDVIAERIGAWMRRHRDASRYASGTYSYVRGTYTRHNLDFYRDVLYLAGLGIERISLEPVVAPAVLEGLSSRENKVASEGLSSRENEVAPEGLSSRENRVAPEGVSSSRTACSYGLTEEDVDALCASYDLLGEEARKGGFAFFHFNAGLAGACLPKRLTGCGAGYEYVAVSPEGDLYPCHQFVGQEAYKLGSLVESGTGMGMDREADAGAEAETSMVMDTGTDTGTEGTGLLAQELSAKFREATIDSKVACRGCWARYSCSGGCHASNVTHGGSLHEVYALGCVLQKKRIEVAYYLQICEEQERRSS